jgi:putative DNA primase/helicase
VRYVSGKTSFASGVEKFAKSDPEFAVRSEAWDKDPFLLGTPGGTVDLKTGILRSSNCDDGISKLVAVAPAPAATCPLWLKFLEETTGGDQQLIQFLKMVAGYSLTGSTAEHMLFFIYGGGGNGKSVFLNVLTGILHDYATVAGMETFVASKSDRHPTDLAMLRGARLVTASETEEGRAWAESRIKQLTGGDPITARFMRQDFFTYRPQFKLIIIGNHRPVLSNVDEAARRRFNIIPFTRTPPIPDRDLQAKLRAEWPGILRWMIDGCLDWQRDGLIRPESVKRETDNYFSDQDLLRQWLDAECDVELGNEYKCESSKALFQSFSAYAKGACDLPGSQKSFSDSLLGRGFERFRTMSMRGFEVSG